MKISFIVPVLNEGEGLKDCLQRLQAFRDQGHEVLVVDGGSKDGSVSGLSEIADRVEISTPGRSRQMNRGAELADGDILLFLHADTLLPEGGLLGVLEACQQGDWGWFDVELGTGSGDGLQQPGQGSQWPYRLIAWMMSRRSRLTSVCTGDQALFVKKSLFLEAGGFPDIPLMEDIALSKLLRRRASAVVVSNKARTSARRWQQNGLISTVWLMWLLRLRYFFGASPESLVNVYYPKSDRLFPSARVGVFAREPVVGRVKTRLIPELGAERALDLYKAMTTRLMSICMSSELAGIELWVSSNPSQEYFLSICKKQNIYLQTAGDLGGKMNSAIAAMLSREGVDQALLLGTDCPSIDTEYLHLALSSLAELEREATNEDGSGKSPPAVVLGPAEDGGYVLIAMNRELPGAFQGIEWGSDEVLAKTLAYLQDNGIKYRLLPVLWDVDRPEDLQKLGVLDPPLHY